MPGDDLDWRWNGASIPAEHWHFHRRLLERYGIVLAPGEFSRMLAKVRNGSVLVVEGKLGREATICIRLREPAGRVYVLVQGKRIVTALAPCKALNDKRRALQGQGEPKTAKTQAASPDKS